MKPAGPAGVPGLCDWRRKCRDGECPDGECPDGEEGSTSPWGPGRPGGLAGECTHSLSRCQLGEQTPVVPTAHSLGLPVVPAALLCGFKVTVIAPCPTSRCFLMPGVCVSAWKCRGLNLQDSPYPGRDRSWWVTALPLTLQVDSFVGVS